jgi:hypothetical protein
MVPQTLTSLAGPGGGEDQRGAPRYTPIIRTGKLITSAGEALCVVRDVSTTGLRVRLFSQLPPDREMLLEFRNGRQEKLEKVWEQAESAGFRFAVPVDVAKLLEEARHENRRGRHMRLNLVAPAAMSVRGEPRRGLIRNISQHGACIECDLRLAVSEPMRIQIGEIADIPAKVRWRKEPLYGVVFEETFTLGELARLIAELQRERPR